MIKLNQITFKDFVDSVRTLLIDELSKRLSFDDGEALYVELMDTLYRTFKSIGITLTERQLIKETNYIYNKGVYKWSVYSLCR